MLTLQDTGTPEAGEEATRTAGAEGGTRAGAEVTVAVAGVEDTVEVSEAAVVRVDCQ